jgi:hypothetical protein
MRTSYDAASALPLAKATANINSGSTPPPSDSSASFHDVLQQEGGDSASRIAQNGNRSPKTGQNPSPSPAPVTAASVTKAADETSPAATTGTTSATDLATPDSAVPLVSTPAEPSVAPSANAPTKNSFLALFAGTGLSAMIVQAAAQISNLRSTATAKPTAETTVANSTGTENLASKKAIPANSATVAHVDLVSLIAQAPLPAATTSTTSTPKAIAGPVAPSSTASGTEAKPSATLGLSVSSGPDLSTLITQVSVPAMNPAPISNPKATSTSTTLSSSATSAVTAAASLLAEKEIPLSGLTPVEPAVPAKEKKSATTGTEGIFLQSGTSGTSVPADAFNLLSSSLADMTQLTVGEQVTNAGLPKVSALESLSGTASGIAGTANVEKGKAMNATLNFSEIYAGTNTVPQQTAVDLHIQLSTNNDFEDALKQVMHVAQLTQTSQSRTPMRVELEIQTPPGAIVNVYVSKQNDQWRAQLSTNDLQALAWVQDKMSSLRQSNDLGVEVRWLPPQMESLSTGSSSNESGLGWDRGGQGQQGYQQQNEQQQSGRQKRSELYSGIGAGQFMEALTAVGSAA